MGLSVGDFRIFGLALGVGLLLACSQGDGTNDPDRSATAPLEIGERLYRGEMDGRGLLFFAAHPTALTLAYDTLRCGLYAAWKGPALGAARRPDGSYAPQGPLYHLQTADTLWRIHSGMAERVTEPYFRSARTDSAGALILRYDIHTLSGVVSVDERVSYDDHYGDIAIRREFTIRDLEPGASIRVLLGGQAYAWKEIWSQAADGILDGKAGEETLTMTDDGVAEVKLTFEGSAR